MPLRFTRCSRVALASRCFRKHPSLCRSCEGYARGYSLGRLTLLRQSSAVRSRCFPVALAVPPGTVAHCWDDQAEPDKTTDWLAVLRPTDLKPPRYIKAPEHFPHILKAFGPLSPFDFRRAVFAIHEIVTGYLSARNRKPPMKFAEADKLLDSIETSFAKSLAAWRRATPLHEAMLTALIITTAPEQPSQRVLGKKIDPIPALKTPCSV